MPKTAVLFSRIKMHQTYILPVLFNLHQNLFIIISDLIKNMRLVLKHIYPKLGPA